MFRMFRASRFHRPVALVAVSLLALLAAAPAAAQSDMDAPTVEEAKAFVDEAEARLLDLTVRAERAAWVQSTYITHDTQILAAEAYEKLITAQGELGTRAARFDGLELPDDVARKLRLLKTAITVPAPSDPETASELTTIASRLEAAYGTGEYCQPGAEAGDDAEGGDACKDLGELERIMAKSREPSELLEAWSGWRTIAPPMRDDYARFVELMNRGAQRLGYADTGELWRAGYDMPPEQVPAELDRLWEQVRPLYEELHCYVRAELSQRYGPEVVPPDGLIPAHVVGNMWAQSWINTYPLVAPEGRRLSTAARMRPRSRAGVWGMTW